MNVCMYSCQTAGLLYKRSDVPFLSSHLRQDESPMKSFGEGNETHGSQN